MLNITLIARLKMACQIRKVDAAEAQQLAAQEIRSLKRLQTRIPHAEHQRFLNNYDQLFRYVSLVLLQHGYTFTLHRPHQTLAALCETRMERQAVRYMIQVRHQLKKMDVTDLPPVAMQTLQQLLAHFETAVTVSLSTVEGWTS